MQLLHLAAVVVQLGVGSLQLPLPAEETEEALPGWARQLAAGSGPRHWT